MDGIAGRPGWAWIFILVRRSAIETRDFIDTMPSPGRVVHSVCGPCWVLTYTFNSKTFQIPYFWTKRVRIIFLTCGSVLTLSHRIIMARLERDRPSIRPSDKFSRREILRSIRSPHVIILVILLFMVGTTLFGLALFLPSIVSELGFNKNKTQLLSVWPFAVGAYVD